MNETERKYNTDPELLHSFILNYNRVSDYHDNICNLATQLCILSEFFDKHNNEYGHSTILTLTGLSAAELYDKIYEEDKMLKACDTILDKITISE